MKHEKVYLVTDGCFWELNKQTGNEHPHSIEVVDLETGAIRYIKSGSKITFVDGDISDIRTQKVYNKQTNKMETEDKKRAKEVPSDRQDVHVGGTCEGNGKKNKGKKG